MSTLIQETALSHWRGKTNSKGWNSGNAVCCTHNGETMDSRGRGGFKSEPDGSIVYSCFNCQFTTGYTPGHPLSYKFRKLLSWLNVDDLEIHRLSIEALREKEKMELLGIIAPEVKKEEIKTNYKVEPLPEQSLSFIALAEFYELKDSLDYPTGLMEAVDYVSHRKIDMRKYDFLWTPDTNYKMNKRVIIPFVWKGQTIGYTARAMHDGILPKYVTHVDSGFVFNMDAQKKDSKFVIVCEGIFDALSVDGVAVMKANANAQQIALIESLDREIIVVPDMNKTGRKLIDLALNNNWSVAFPVWAETCTDINEAVCKYGKLFVLKTILDSVERSKLKIKLRRKKI
jgi:hypothetical protein